MKAFWVHPILWALSVCTWLVATASGVSRTSQNGLKAAVWAWLLHLLFASIALGALATSRAWRDQRAAIRDGGFPSLRALAIATPVAVLVQAGLGTAFHAGVIGVVPHAAWAFLAAMLLMMQATFVLTQAAAPALLKRISIVTLALVVLQVVLGVAALLVRTSGQGEEAWLAAPLTLHTAVGALLVAASVLSGALTLRHFEPAADEAELISPGRNS